MNCLLLRTSQHLDILSILAWRFAGHAKIKIIHFELGKSRGYKLTGEKLPVRPAVSPSKKSALNSPERISALRSSIALIRSLSKSVCWYAITAAQKDL